MRNFQGLARTSMFLTAEFLLKKSFDKKSDSRGPGFLKRLSVGTPMSQDTPGQSTRKMPQNEKCHEIGPSGSDFDDNLCGSRGVPARSGEVEIRKTKKKKNFSGDTRAPPKFLKTAPSDKKFG